MRTLDRSTTDRLFEIVYVIETPSNRTYDILNNGAFTFDIVNASCKTASGTITANIKYNSVSVTGLSAIAVTSTRAVTTATANNSFAVGGVLQIATTSNSSADMLSIVLTCRRTGGETGA